MNLNRRNFIAGLGTLAGAAALNRSVHAFGAGMNPSKRIVVVWCPGGFDGQSVGAIPWDDPDYQANRTSTRYVDGVDGFHKLSPADAGGTKYGVNPGLKIFQDVWNGVGAGGGIVYPNQLALFHRAGYSTGGPNFSHFVSQDIWLSGYRNVTAHDSGWIGRWADRFPTTWGITGSLGLNTGNTLLYRPQSAGTPTPLLMRSVDSFEVPDYENYPFDSLVRKLGHKVGEEGVTQSSTLVEAHRDANLGAHDLAQLVEDGTAGYVDPGYPATSIGDQLRDIARLIHAEGYTQSGLTFCPTVYMTPRGGHDTHDDQKNRMGTTWSQIGGALDAFVRDLQDPGGLNKWDSTLVLVFTEFGRRNVENGSGGTDHGHGNSMYAMGGCVVGGHYGQLSPGDLQAANLPVDPVNDFRNVFGGALQHFMAQTPGLVGQIFDEVNPAFTVAPIDYFC